MKKFLKLVCTPSEWGWKGYAIYNSFFAVWTFGAALYAPPIIREGLFMFAGFFCAFAFVWIARRDLGEMTPREKEKFAQELDKVFRPKLTALAKEVGLSPVVAQSLADHLNGGSKDKSKLH